MFGVTGGLNVSRPGMSTFEGTLNIQRPGSWQRGTPVGYGAKELDMQLQRRLGGTAGLLLQAALEPEQPADMLPRGGKKALPISLSVSSPASLATPGEHKFWQFV